MLWDKRRRDWRTFLLSLLFLCRDKSSWIYFFSSRRSFSFSLGSLVGPRAPSHSLPPTFPLQQPHRHHHSPSLLPIFSPSSDVHVTADNVIVMFHDPSLERTTDGKGLIKEQAYHGGIENVRTKAEPHQQIPTFKEVCDLLMKSENRHVKLNVSIWRELKIESICRALHLELKCVIPFFSFLLHSSDRHQTRQQSRTSIYSDAWNRRILSSIRD